MCIQSLYLQCIGLLVVVVCLSCANPAVAQPSLKKHILILYSYHQEDPWSKHVQAGINEAFYIEPIEMYSEYLDVRRHPSKDSFPVLQSYFLHKFQSIPLDAIICADDEALQFLEQYHQELFPDVPVFFCGIEDLDSHNLDDIGKAVGVQEVLEIQKTIDLAVSLHPKTKHIFFIIDSSDESRRYEQNINEIRGWYDPEIQFITYKEWTLADLFNTLVSLQPNTIVLPLTTTRESSGRVMDAGYSTRVIAQNSSMPVYTLWDTMIKDGVVGGYVVDRKEQGKKIAEMTLQYLKGMPISEFPTTTVSPNSLIMDYRMIQALNLPRSVLPENVILLNEPSGLYHQYKTQIWLVTTALICIIVTTILIMVINVRLRKRAEAVLHDQIQFLQNLIDTIPNPIFFVDDKKNIQGCNRTYEILTEKPIQELINTALAASHNESFASLCIQSIDKILQGKEYLGFEAQLLQPNRSQMECIVHLAGFHQQNSETKGVLGIIVDITELKNLEYELRVAYTEQENKVKERTKDLLESNQKLELEMSERLRMEREILQISDREQHRIGQDLHDGLCQQLLAIQCMADVLRQQDQKLTAVHSELICKISTHINDLILQTRTLARGLSPVDLETGGIHTAFEDLASTVYDLFGVKCTVEIPSTITLPNKEKSIHIFRIVQEAINNSIRHGKAKSVQIHANQTNGSLSVTIQDDGKGMPQDPSHTARKGMGLKVMSYRTDLIGGTLQIQSNQRQGTVVACTFPVLDGSQSTKRVS